LAVDIGDASTLNLQAYRACGAQPSEVLIDDETLRRADATPAVDMDAVEMLVAMGFAPVQAAHALRQTNNSGAEMALNWILANPDAVPDEEEDRAKAGNQGICLFLISMAFFLGIFL
jgi:uncharacterized UBP type Zn finger protein